MNSQASTDQSQMVTCPNSFVSIDEHTRYSLHQAPANELEKNGGVCRQCREQFRLRNAAAIADLAETPVDMNQPLRTTRDMQFKYGFDDARELHPTAEVDFSSIDEALGIIASESEDVRAQTVELFQRLLTWIWRDDKTTLREATARFTVICAGIRPDLVDRTYLEIGRELNVTKAAISKAALLMQDSLGFKFTRSRSAVARSRMAAAQIGHPSRKGKARSS